MQLDTEDRFPSDDGNMFDGQGILNNLSDNGTSGDDRRGSDDDSDCMGSMDEETGSDTSDTLVNGVVSLLSDDSDDDMSFVRREFGMLQLS